ncbi:rcc01693 family protein [Martelella mediterranea]|uniref:rcc01693 family protein n=1 Tax=Martelella mediterranea TaxID=293089 RepID=UPI002479210A|nr:rcc01693 family protein [Martelella mediterranea]
MPFPWCAVLHTGLCQLRLSPLQFWALSPIEFAAMAGHLAPATTYPNRQMLSELMKRFPDESRRSDNGV